MRKFLALSYVLLIAGFACVAHAQLPQTAAGRGAAGPSGPCTGAAIHTSNANNFQDGIWSANSATVPSNSEVAPDSTSTASNLVSNGGPFPIIANPSRPALLAATGTYAFSAYFKTIVNPPWVWFRISDDATFAFGTFVNLATATNGVLGLNDVGAVTTCQTATVDRNGYVFVTFAGHVLADTGATRIEVILAHGDNDLTSTNLQELYAWQVSP